MKHKFELIILNYEKEIPKNIRVEIVKYIMNKCKAKIVELNPMKSKN